MPEPAPVILLTFANDLDNPLRQLAEEARLLRLALRDAHRAGHCQVEFRQNATLGDVLDALQDFHDQVAIFHYGGHAGSFFVLRKGGD